MLAPLLLILAAVPSVQGLDKPKKAQTAKLGKSELAAGTVVARCWDLGKVMLVEVNDPGLKGAKDAWLKKKTGDAMPPCDGNDTDTQHLESIAGYGYVEGSKGDFIFVAGSDTFGDRIGLRVVSATNGALLVDVERSISKPATLTVRGTESLAALPRLDPRDLRSGGTRGRELAGSSSWPTRRFPRT